LGEYCESKEPFSLFFSFFPVVVFFDCEGYVVAKKPSVMESVSDESRSHPLAETHVSNSVQHSAAFHSCSGGRETLLFKLLNFQVAILVNRGAVLWY